MAEKDVFARREEFERSKSESSSGSARINNNHHVFVQRLTFFLPFHSHHSDSCPLGFGHPHHDGRPGVLPRQRKEEVGAAPARARQHHPCYLRGPRAAGLQHHHQAHLTHSFLALDSLRRRWPAQASRGASFRWTYSKHLELFVFLS